MRVAGVATGRGSSVCGVPPLLPSDLLPCRSLPSFHRLQSIKVSLPCKSKKSQQQQRQWHSSATTATASLRDVENMLRAAEIKTIAPRDAQSLLLSSPNNNNSSSQSYKMLDVRPIWEREKAHVVGSIHVPLFIEDVDTSALTLLKKWIQMGYGGMWMGQRLTVKNTDFVDQVEDHLPSKEQRLMVVCGEGLRSMLAIDELLNAGYTNVAWVGGGFNSVRDGDFLNVGGSTKLQWATIGGASEYLLKLTVLLTGLLNTVAGDASSKKH
ncbi:hypothetical protein CY35_03G047000 [Sphagnum magellanicum]|nr:hypothetical protein CY35_03G047000 [Sphagnum magellanicum]KAH9567849.1 hypothetical protein CY35_03G047000 [Sphagnum magellanicum]